jgi:BT1 family
MFLAMCPEGSEGASYAMLTTISNLANSVSNSLSGVFANVWDVSNESLEKHNYDGLWKLTILCGLSQLVGLIFISLLPSSLHDQRATQRCSDSSAAGGYAFVSVQFLSLVFVIVNAAITIAYVYIAK